MNAGSAPPEVTPRLVAKIVVSYVAHHSVTPDELSGLITSVGQIVRRSWKSRGARGGPHTCRVGETTSPSRLPDLPGALDRDAGDSVVKPVSDTRGCGQLLPPRCGQGVVLPSPL